MGDPRFYYYPDAAGSLESVDFAMALSDIQETHLANVEDAYTGDYVAYRSFLGATMRVRIVLERFGTRGADTLERDAQSLVTHLQRGGAVGFSRDHAKTWASVTSTGPTRGDTVLYTSGGNGFTAWSLSGTPAVGDEVAIETPPADYIREIRTVGALTVTPPVHLPLAAGCRYTYSGPAVVRWRDFYPVLRMPRDLVGRTFITHDHRRNFTLDVTLEYNPAEVLALYGTRGSRYDATYAGALGRIRDMGAGPALRGASAERGFGGSSIEELISGASSDLRSGITRRVR